MSDGSMGLTEIERTTTSDRVYAQLRRSITQGTMPGGTVLNQIDLAAQFGVSRVPVREALRRLQAEHLLVARPFQRYVVHSPSSSQVLDLLDVREVLEQLALRRLLASPVLRSETLADARGVIAVMAPGDPYGQWIVNDRQLHRILNGAGSEIARIVDEARERIQQFLLTTTISRRSQVLAVAEHHALLDGLEREDEDVVMEIHSRHMAGTRAAIERLINDHDAAAARAEDPTSATTKPPRRKR